MARVLLDQDAKQDLKQLVEHIAVEQARPDSARKLAAKIRDECQRFASNPLLGEMREDLFPSLRQFIVRPFVVFYVPFDNGIRVLRIIHGARDYPALFS
jgi:toxin ParE1/3/4